MTNVRLPNELLIMIYKVADMETKLSMNKALKWSLKIFNPYGNFFERRIHYKKYIDSMWNEVGFMRYIKK